MNNNHTFTILLQPETAPDFMGYYNASVPALPVCFSYGENRAQALTNIREAIELYLKDLEEEGEPIPEDHIEQVQLAVPA